MAEPIDARDAELLLALNQGAKITVGYVMERGATKNYCTLTPGDVDAPEQEVERYRINRLARVGYIEADDMTHLRVGSFAMKGTAIVLTEKGRQALRLSVARGEGE